MKPNTVLSTDWIEVHGSQDYTARVFLTDRDEAYMEAVIGGKRRLFRADAKLLKLGEIGFFEKVMESAEELPLERAFEIRLIDRSGE